MTDSFFRAAAVAVALALALPAATAWAQSGGGDGESSAESGGDLDSLFESEMIEDESGGDGGDSAAAEGAGAGDLDALFDVDVVETETSSAAGGAGMSDAPEETLLTAAGVDIGGSFRYAPEVELGFPSYDAVSEALRGERAAERALRHDLAAQLYFDARPGSDFRVFGKAKVDYELPVPGAPAGQTGPAGQAPASGPAAAGSGAGQFNFTMFELFADFHWDDRVFFRAGKQRADWGVGRFFSPADLMSLVTIDPLNPLAEREGPVALKAHAPIDVHNAYLYLITGAFRDPLDVGAGARGEVVVGGVELGFGGLIQADLVPKGFATVTGAAGDFDLFGEFVVQQGTERNLIELDAAGNLQVTSRDARAGDWFPAATAGALYRATDPNVVLAAQYYYNPLGYANSAALGPAREALRARNGEGEGPPRTGPQPQAVDLLFFGLHYAGASAAWNEIGDSDLSASLFWLSNLSDRSGILRPLLTYQVLEYARLSVGARVGYGTGATEYAENVAFTLGAELGVGSF